MPGALRFSPQLMHVGEMDEHACAFNLPPLCELEIIQPLRAPQIIWQGRLIRSFRYLLLECLEAKGCRRQQHPVCRQALRLVSSTIIIIFTMRTDADETPGTIGIPALVLRDCRVGTQAAREGSRVYAVFGSMQRLRIRGCHKVVGSYALFHPSHQCHYRVVLWIERDWNDSGLTKVYCTGTAGTVIHSRNHEESVKIARGLQPAIRFSYPLEIIDRSTRED